MQVTPLPDLAAEGIRPRDVFFQTQILIAELNLIKLRLETVSSTPLAIKAPDDTTPTDVYQQALLVEHLVKQFQSGAQISLAGPSEAEVR